MVKAEIISKESIKPSSPTPDDLRTFRLSSIDQFGPPFFHPSHIQCYSHDKNSSNANRAEISSVLKRSLSDALVLYYPFAGRLKGQSSVDCNDQGVDFFEVRVDANMSDIIEAPQIEVLTQFNPKKSEENGGVLLSIQLNYFICGSIAIGTTICHKIADGYTMGMFIKTWAAVARGKTDTVGPSFVASSCFPPKETIPYDSTTGSPLQWSESQRFLFSSSKIAALRAEVLKANNVIRPSHTELVTAALWKWVNAKKGRLSVASHTVNIRRRMDLPLSESALGNLFLGVFSLGSRELDLAELITKMRKAAQYIFDKEVNCAIFSSWCGLPFYGWDFACGELVWVSTAQRGYPNNVILIDSVSDIGGIEAWIRMDGVDTTKLEQELLDHPVQ